MPNLIATLTDSVNVSPISWRQGSLTQRVADLALGGGGANPAGSQLTSTGIVRGFEVYPDAVVSQKVNLLVAEGTLDSLVVFTDVVLETSLQYRTFGTVGVVFTGTPGNRYLGFRPNFTNRVIELVDYSETEFNAGTLTTDSAILIGVVNVVASTVVSRTGIRYAGQSAAPTLTPFARGQVYSPELVDRYVLEFNDSLPIPYELTGTRTAAITGNALVISGTPGTSAISFPIYQYMKPDARILATLDVSCKIRASIYYDATGTTVFAQAVFGLSSGGSTFGLSVDYPYGSVALRTNGIGYVTAVEIVPLQGVSRPDWGNLQILFNLNSGNLTIHKIIFEVDRVYAPVQTDGLILGSQSYQSSSPDIYATVGATGLRVADTTLPDDLVSVVYSTGVDVSEGTAKLARITADGLGIYDDVDPSAATELVVLDNSSVDVRDKSGASDVFVLVTPSQIEVQTSTVSPAVTFETTIESDEIKIVRTPAVGTAQSVTATWENIVAERDVYSVTFGDLEPTPLLPANNFGLYATDTVTTSYIYQNGFVVTKPSTFEFTIIGAQGITTTGPNGYFGINAPKLLAKVTWNGTNWVITSSYCAVPGAPLGFQGVTNDNTEFTLRKPSATFIYSFASIEKPGDAVAAICTGTTDIVVKPTVAGLANVYVLAF